HRLSDEVAARDAESVEHVEVVSHEMVDAGECRTARSPEAGMMSDDQAKMLREGEQPVEPACRPGAVEEHDGIASSGGQHEGFDSVDVEARCLKPSALRFRSRQSSSPRGGPS